MTGEQVSIFDVFPMRERMLVRNVHYLTKDPEEKRDFFTLYRSDGKVLARSNPGEQHDTLRVIFNGVVYIASPGYKTAEISIEFFSLTEVMSEEVILEMT